MSQLSRIEKSSYLVGGAVRDKLLGLSPKDLDWVVVGITPQEMVRAGFIAVGQDFPVFLHPHSREEYALARTERKSGHGYKGFEFYTATDVTLESDLLRRDLTINAIAEDHYGTLRDPFNGESDLQQRILRHVSDAFAEDPLRVFRAARFAAQLSYFGFTIAKETCALMADIVKSNELAHLVGERVWQETAKALNSNNPRQFFEVLQPLGGLKHWFPEVDQLFGVPQRADYHPEVDTGLHTLLCLDKITEKTDNLDTRYAVLCHDLGKGITPADILPSHKGHEKSGIPLVKRLNDRLKVPKTAQKLAEKVCEFHLHIHRAFELKPSTLLKLFYQTDAFRNPDRFATLLLACEADAQGRTNFENRPYPQRQYCLDALQAALEVKTSQLQIKQKPNKAQGLVIREALDQARVKAIKTVQSRHTTT
jgi:tRNA nucleotidyltransferase (CCA-adding enzyme)